MGHYGVPWGIGGGEALVSDVIGRGVINAIFNDEEGVRGALHCKVEALGTPGPQIRVGTGQYVVTNRAAGTANDLQSYYGAIESEDVKDVNATDAVAGRSDLVVIRIKNPNIAGENWEQPTNATDGPYVDTWIQENVPAGTTSIRDVEPGWSAITLARIDIPVSTAAITQAMIKDLRDVVNPISGVEPPPDEPDTEAASKVQSYVRNSGSQLTDTLTMSNTSYKDWPLAATVQVAIPKWATRMTYDVEIVDVRVGSSNTYRGAFGDCRMSFGGLLTPDNNFDFDGAETVHSNEDMQILGEMTIPASMRGTTVTVKTQGKLRDAYHPQAVLLAGDNRTKTKFHFNFRQTPSYT